jgi:hypothetical protein
MMPHDGLLESAGRDAVHPEQTSDRLLRSRGHGELLVARRWGDAMLHRDTDDGAGCGPGGDGGHDGDADW